MIGMGMKDRCWGKPYTLLLTGLLVGLDMAAGKLLLLMRSCFPAALAVKQWHLSTQLMYPGGRQALYLMKHKQFSKHALIIRNLPPVLCRC